MWQREGGREEGRERERDREWYMHPVTSRVIDLHLFQMREYLKSDCHLGSVSPDCKTQEQLVTGKRRGRGRGRGSGRGKGKGRGRGRGRETFTLVDKPNVSVLPMKTAGSPPR